MKNRLKLMLFCVSSVLFIGCDQVTKHIAKEQLMFHAPITYLHNTVILEYAENTGAALSLGDSMSKTASFWLLSIVPLLCLVALFVYVILRINGFGRLKTFSLSLILAGGLGNIIDRIFYDRHVTDFMNVGIGNTLRTGIFNVADMCVTAGVIGLLIISFREKKHEPVAELRQNTGDIESTQ
jgi:signal peptidase II